MEEESDDKTPNKITRIRDESLVINLGHTEEKYRNKYLPDPTKITDEKLVCTVCAVSLAKDVHEGNDIFVHRVLHVLICKKCYMFYGDGSFSPDEDGDDKFCRWCGQGGHLYLCSACTVAFCQKCVKRNLKSSAQAELKNDNWKCYICVPRPIFGSRAICWAATELNKIGKEKKRLKKEEQLKNIGSKNSKVEDDHTDTVKKRKFQSEDSSSDTSSDCIPDNKSKFEILNNECVNGPAKKHKKRKENTSSEDEKCFKNKSKQLESTDISNSDSDVKTNTKIKLKVKKKKKLDDSDDYLEESTDFEEDMERKGKCLKKKHDDSTDELYFKSHKETSKRKFRHLSESAHSDSTGEHIEKKLKTGSSYSSDGLSCKEDDKRQKKALNEGNKIDSNENSDIKENFTNNNEFHKEFNADTSYTHLLESNTIESDNTLLDCTNHSQKEKVVEEQTVVDETLGKLPLQEKSEMSLKEVTTEKGNVEINIKLARVWLDSTLNDISELGSFIALQANKFGQKQINICCLTSYTDVLEALSKLKQLVDGVHLNCNQIEDDLESSLHSWKIYTGLEEPEKNNSIIEDPTELYNSVQGCTNKNEDTSDILPEKTGCKHSLDDNSISNDTQNGSGIDGIVNVLKAQTDNEMKLLLENEGLNSTININGDEITSEVTSDNFICDVNVQPTSSSLDLDVNNAASNNTVATVNINQHQNDHELTEKIDVNEGKSKNENNVSLEDILKNSHSENTVSVEDIVKEHSEVSDNKNTESTSVEKDFSTFIDENSMKNQDCFVNKTVDEGIETVEQKHSGNESVVDKTELSEMPSVEKDSAPTQEDSSFNMKDEDNEALQLLLYSSTEDEMESSSSSSDESDEINLDDSDLDITDFTKRIIKRATVSKKKKNTAQDKSKNIKNKEVENNDAIDKKQTKKVEEELDSEAEIDMLTDLTKLKKKTPSRRILSMDSNEEDSDSSEDENDKACKESSRKGKKYKNESKKRREEERNELFGFLKDDANSEDEMDITKNDLDVIEDQYASSSSESMSLEAFSQKMNAKWKELEKEQENMNLQMLLASESEEGSDGGDDIILDPEDEKKKKGQKIKEEKLEEDTNKDSKEENDVQIKEEISNDEESDSINIKIEQDEEYEQFLEGISKDRPIFKGLGSSSEESEHDKNIEIKEEPLDIESKIKVEPENSDIEKESSTESDTSGDLFMDKGKKKSMKKKSWRNHRLLRIKLSDTDTSDEERWWQRRLEKEQKKKEGQGDRPKKSSIEKKKGDNSSDKENKKLENKKQIKQEEPDSGSSTLELSSTESSGSSVFKKKKRKKAATSDSDVIDISEEDKKRKKKKRTVVGDSSDESNESGDDEINISQKSKQGESPGKGGRKNIRKVLTKNELAAATKAAAKEEEERRKRIAARQKLFNEMFEIKEAEILEKLVLDFDPETKTELISVDQDLVVKMKPHQAKGVKFMWDSCFESISQLKTKKGSGCILAHCMGLGKTFQVVSLVHTILKHKDTNVNTVLVVCPLSTVLNWFSEFDKWLDDVAGGKDIKVYHLTKYKRPHERSRQLNLWQRTGGVMILGYEMFRILTNENSKKFRLLHRESFQKTLIDPGADLVVCDEGHMLKNESTLLSKAMSRIKTLRRIVLTGTPMQNNLKEYHCMVQFVKPNLLGTRKEFLNQFVNPITNGQFVDSTESDVKVMKRRSHVLHKMLEGLVQRFDYSVLTPFLPPKHEFVISLRLSEVQIRLYQFYLDHFSQRSNNTRTGSQLFTDWQALGRIWTHPLVLKMSTDKAELEREKRRLEESEEEGSVKDFINDRSSSSLSLSSSHSSASSDEGVDGNGGGKKMKQSKTKKKDVDNNNKDEDKKIEPEKKEITNISNLIETEINLISSEEEENDNNKSETKESNKSPVTELEKNEESVKQMTNNDEEMKEVSKEIEEVSTELEKEKTEVEEPNKDWGNESEDVQEIKSTENMNNLKEDTPIVENKLNKEEKANEQLKKNEGKKLDSRSGWWKTLIDPKHLDDINQSGKLILLFAILRECEMIEDKVLVFSQSLFSLDLIEYFLDKVDQATKENRLDESLGNHAGCWTKGLDYFRLDGSSSSENRSAWCKSFNREDNTRARLFLISTRAGGLGINLTAANRVIIFDASWNPSHDIQSIFRIYRFGQKKPCYVYRFIAHGTMEEKVYDRQVAKQSLSSRVVDEQQVHRHFSMNDLNELYTFTPPTPKDKKLTPVLPKDRLMAELLTQYSDWVEKYHEHDSLLENVVEEELNEEERKLAWEDYENDKKRGYLPTPGTNNFTPIDMSAQAELFRKSLKIKYPNASEQEMNAMLSTLIYQVNSMRANPSQPQQQAQVQQGSSTSYVGLQQNMRPTANLNLSAQQMFNFQRNHLYQKYGQQVLQTQEQKMGHVGMKSRKMNVNPAKAYPETSNYTAQMRLQQQANLARIQNQMRMQQQQKVQKPLTQNLPQQQRIQPRDMVQKPLTQNLPQQQNNRYQQQNRNIQPQRIQNHQLVQNRQPQVIRTDLQQIQRNWKPTQQQRTNVNQFQRQEQPATALPPRLQNNRQVQETSIKNPVQLVQQNQQKWRQEVMRRRISALQQQKKMNLQQTLQQSSRNNDSSAAAAAHRKKLEEMQNRYKASRKNVSSDVSIVEIDDEPSRPSN